MHKYLLTLSYNGTQYSGWQKQSKNKNTIQEICQNAVKKILVGDFHLGGASRTDKGVHADDQKILLKYSNSDLNDSFIKNMNHNLPNDIEVKDIELLSNHFHPFENIENKTYTYRLSSSSIEQFNIFTLPFYIKIDLEKTQLFLDLFIGVHNFSAFSIKGARTPNPIRNIMNIESHFKHNVLTIIITGNGFLKYMVRYIMGSLILFLKDEITLDDARTSLKEGTPLRRAYKAPANGLTLTKINIKKADL